MFSGWNELPAEIQQIIFTFLDKNDEAGKEDLRQCALTCRDWRQMAQEILLIKITISSTSDIDDMLNTSLLFSEAVKEIDCHKLEILEKDHQLRYLDNVNTLFPNLEKIEAHIVFRSAVYSSVKDGKFTNLKQLPLPSGEEEENMYAARLMLRKNKITSICLEEKNSVGRIAHTIAPMINQLGFFTHLKHLRLEIHNEPDESQKINKLIERITLATGFSSLKELEISVTSRAGWTDPREQSTPIHPIKSLKRFIITYCKDITSKQLSCDEHYMIYIMKKLPELEYMEMTYTDNRMEDVYIISDIPPPSFNTVIQYLRFLSTMPYCLTPKFFTNESTGHSVDQLFNNVVPANSSFRTRFDVCIKFYPEDVILTLYEYCSIQARYTP